MKTRLALFVALLSLAPQPARALSCGKWLAAPFTAGARALRRVAVYRARTLGHAEFRKLQGRTVGDYFPDGERESLFADLELLLDNLPRHVGRLHRYAEFRAWWLQKRAERLDWSEASKMRTVTLGQLVLALHLDFTEGREGPGLAARAKAVLSPRAWGRMSWAATKLIAGTFLGLTFIGPASDIFRATFSSLTHIVAETASQKGTQWLEPASDRLATVLRDPSKLARAKNDLEGAKAELREMEALVDTLDTLTPEQAQDRWERLEDGFFLFYLRYNQKLPAHLHDGRYHLKDNIADKLMTSASALATFDNQFEAHRAGLRALEGRALMPEEEKEKRRHLSQMEAAQARIAAALANQKLYDIMYSDFSSVPERDKARVPLTRAYEVFHESFRFDLYMKEYSRNMRLILARMGVQVARFEAEVKAAESR